MEDKMYKYLTIYGSTGYTSFRSIKQEIEPFRIYSPVLKRDKTKEELNIVISSAAGGIGLTVTEYLSKMGYRNIYGIAGSNEKCQVAIEMGCKGALNYKRYYKEGKLVAKDFEAGLKEMLGGEECDLYYENVG